MPQLRSQFDADRTPQSETMMGRTEIHRFEVPCSVCGRPLFVDRETKLKLEREVEHDLDINVTCLDCERDYDTLAFE